MKVVLLAPTPPPVGGIAGWTVRMLKASLKNGWEVVVVDEKILGKRDMFDGRTRHNWLLEVKRCWNIWRDLNRALRDKEATVVHSCIPANTLPMLRELVCACITKLHRRKFIVHFRCTVPNLCKGRVANFVLKRLCNISDTVMSLNTQTSNYLAQITKTPIVLIPNFVNDGEIAESHPIRQTLKTVVYVGGLVETKGAKEIIKLAQENPDIEFRCVGTSDGAVVEYARSHNIQNLTVVGTKDRAGVKEELQNADAFLFLTFFDGEGFSNALTEAMAAGLPCVVTDWAANADMIDEGEGGYVVPVRDARAASEAVRKLASPELREQFSQHNIRKVKSQYVEKAVVDQYVDAYEACLRM